MATIYNTAATLDGFLATTDNSLSWLFEVSGADDAESSIADFLAGIGAMAMGSTTYEWLLEHESLIDNPAKWQEWYPSQPTWVFTHSDLPVVEFADAGLLDRMVVTIAPVTLGAGAPLLPREMRASRLRLVSIEQRGQFAEL